MASSKSKKKDMLAVSNASVVEEIDACKMVSDKYMEYSKSTIAERMFPFIDGFKPVQRRVLYSMWELGLIRGRVTKSSQIVGITMGNYHPHGDASIYEALANMTDCHDGSNAPLIIGDGTFGKQWADKESVPCSSQRYTEAGLSKLAQETLFDGLNENAVDMVDNYLALVKEPMLLPTKFPNIIVSTTKGIACGLGTYIPGYGLREACDATIGLLKGDIKTPEELAIVLGVPDFFTGGKVGISKKQLLDLCTTGETGGIVLTSKYEMENATTMRITEVPYNTTIDKVVASVTKFIELKIYPGVTGIINTTGDLKLGAKISLQRGTDPAEAFQYLCAFTDVQKKISFSTKFVKWNDEIENFELVLCGIYDLLVKHWIPWNLERISRVYMHRYNKVLKEEVNHSGWQKISGRTKEYLDILADNKRENSKRIHIEMYGLTEEEEKVLSALSAYKFTQDEVEANLKLLAENQAEQKRLKAIADSVEKCTQISIKELEGIRDTFGSERKSEVEGIHTSVSLKVRKKEKVEQETYVAVTNDYFLKRAEKIEDANSFDARVGVGDSLKSIFKMKTTDKLLVFSTFGFVYKIDVDKIDNVVKTKFKDTVWNLVSRQPNDNGDAFLIMPAGNYDKEFNIVYPHTAIRKIMTSMYTGRNVYKDAFSGFIPGSCFITERDEFLVITEKHKALYVNLNKMGTYVSPSKKQLTQSLPATDSDIKFVVGMDELDGFGAEQIYRYSFGFTDIKRGDIKQRVVAEPQMHESTEIVCGIEVETVVYKESGEDTATVEVLADGLELPDGMSAEDVQRLMNAFDETTENEDDDDYESEDF